MNKIKAWSWLPLLALILVGCGWKVAEDNQYPAWLGIVVGAAIAVAATALIAARRRRLYPNLF